MHQPETRIFYKQMTGAGFGHRMAAFGIDHALLALPAWLLLHIAGGAAVLRQLVLLRVITVHFITALLSVIALHWLYRSLMESGPACATVGKMAAGIIVTDAAGGRITFAVASKRYFAKWLSAITLLAGYFMLLWDKQTLHDKIAGTFVIKRPPLLRMEQ